MYRKFKFVVELSIHRTDTLVREPPGPMLPTYTTFVDMKMGFEHELSSALHANQYEI